MKVPVEALVWSLASGRGDLSGLSTDEIQPETRSQRACQFIHHVSWQHLLSVVVMLAQNVIRTITDAVVKLHEQKLRQERLRPNDYGYYEIPLDDAKVPMFPLSNTLHQEKQGPYSDGYTPNQFYRGRRD